MKANEYRCDSCKGVYVKDWTEEEALQEMKNNFGNDIEKDECGVLCDDCYKKFMGWFKKVGNQ